MEQGIARQAGEGSTWAGEVGKEHPAEPWVGVEVYLEARVNCIRKSDSINENPKHNACNLTREQMRNSLLCHILYIYIYIYIEREISL